MAPTPSDSRPPVDSGSEPSAEPEFNQLPNQLPDHTQGHTPIDFVTSGPPWDASNPSGAKSLNDRGLSDSLPDLWGIYSVWWRHFQVYRRTWLVNFLPPISEPIVYLVAFGYGFSPLVGNVNYLGQTLPYVQFLAPGMIAVGVLFQSFFEAAFGTFIRLRFQKTWQALLTAPLSFRDVFVGDWLWAATRGMIAGSLTAIVAIVAGLYPLSGLILALPVMILGALLFSAFGLWMAGFFNTVDQLNVPIFLVIIPMFTLCGTYFPRETLPPALERVAALLPLSALVDLLRWPLGLPPWWPLSLLWLLLLLSLVVTLAVQRIRPLVFR